MSGTDMDRRVDAVRHFNRFYTQQIGVLREGLLKSRFSLTEGRVLYELAHRVEPTATELCKDLGLDAGYLSRILRNFEKQGFIDRKTSEADGRQSHLSLTRRGRASFAPLNQRSHDEVAAMLGKLSVADRARLTAAMQTIEELLGAQRQPKEPYLLRPHQPGDMGWVIHRHAVLYAQEYRWNEQFEALVAGITADFIEKFDPRLDRCWIAERDGGIIGSAFLVKKSKGVAQLRLLLVEPNARGLGLGRRLVDECVRFARQAGYKKITLWTNSILHSAQSIYLAAGFQLIAEEPHHSFGHDLTGQNWELKL
jgi:DNA-binding MarR family transcriptional regulator/N-acetylglutamate synthase-like GNAT family acetyltransferase